MSTSVNAPSSPRAASLWHEALQTLSESDRAQVDITSPDRIAVLQDLLAVAEAKKAASLEKRWKYRKNGQDVAIRDKLDRMVTWIQRFKDVGSTIMQYDPAHAALPWAGVLLVLQITTCDVQTFGLMVDGLETVSQFIAQYSVLEDVYLRQRELPPTFDQLQLALVKLYVSILRYLAKARQYFAKRTATRVLRSVVSTPESEVQQYLDVISKKAAELDRCLLVVQSETTQSLDFHAKTMLRTLTEMQRPITTSSAQVAQLHDHLTNQERLRMLAWLSRVPNRLHHQSEGKDYMAGSGSWLLKNTVFVDWKRSSTSAMLWLHGTPGCGKTKLVYRSIQQQLDTNEAALVAYFYCARNPAEPERGDPDEVVRSLLKQLALTEHGTLRRPVIEAFQARQEDAERDGIDITPLSLSESKALMLEVMEMSQVPVTIFIDALDECDQSRRYNLLAFLDEILRDSPAVTRVMVSSRDDGDIYQHFEPRPNIYIRPDDNREDINRYIDHLLSQALSRGRFLNGTMSEKLRAEVSENLKLKAQGMFRWVTLQVDNLCDPSRIKIESDVLQEVGHLPGTLREAYDRAYGRVLDLARPSRTIAERVFKWLLCAQKMLTEEDLVAGVVFALERHVLTAQSILDICCNMVVLDDRGHFRFAHLSVREYLETLASFTPELCHGYVLERCLESYVNTTVDWRVYGHNELDVFVKPYAMLHWPGHFLSAGDPATNKTLSSLMDGFIFQPDESLPDTGLRHDHSSDENCGENRKTLQTSAAFKDWVTDVWNASRYSGGVECDDAVLQRLESVASPSSTPVFFACTFNVLWIFEAVNDSGWEGWEEQNFQEDGFVHVALKWGSRDALAWLLDKARISSADMSRALAMSLEDGDLRAAKILVEHHADGFRRRRGQTALQFATSCGDAELVRNILRNVEHFEAHAFAESICFAYQEAEDLFPVLHEACLALSPRNYLRALVAVQMRSQDDAHSGNPFHPLDDLFTMLLNHTLDSSSEGMSSIYRLSEILGENFQDLVVFSDGQLAVSRLSDSKGKLYHWSRFVPTFLLAFEMDSQECLDILLALGGADISNGKSWKRFLSKQTDTKRRLFDIGWWFFSIVSADVDPDSDTESESSVDSDASRRRQYTTLFEDLDLLSGSLAWCLRLMQNWLDQGANIDMTDEDGQTPLIVAAKSSNITLFQFLLDNGANVHATDKDGHSALSNAIRKDNSAAVKALSRSGVDINGDLSVSFAALKIAAAKCHHDMILVLRGLGARRPGSIPHRESILVPFLAEEVCTDCISRMLLSSSEAQARQGGVPYIFNLAARALSQAIQGSQLPLEATSLEDGLTPLQAAVSMRDWDAIDTILGTPININETDSQGFTALHYAATRACGRTLGQLLHHGIDPDQRDHQGRTALHLLVSVWRRASYDGGQAVQLLLDAMSPAGLDATDVDGNTALHFAVGSFQMNNVNLLLDAGSSHDIKNIEGQTAMELAMSLGRYRIMASAGIGFDIFGDSHELLFADRVVEDPEDEELHSALIDKGRPETEDSAHGDDRTTPLKSPSNTTDGASTPGSASKTEEGEIETLADGTVDWFGGYDTAQWTVLSGQKLSPLRPVGAVYRDG